MKDLLKILLLEDNVYDAEEIMRRLQSNEIFNCEFRLATGKAEYLQALEEFCPAIVLSDHSLPQFDSKEALAIARQRFPDIPFIMVTGTISDEYAIDMIKTGADDYILKDRMMRLPAAIMASVQKRKAEKEKKMLEQEILTQKIQEQRKIARAIVKAQEKERNYLGQELHDNVNQILAATKMMLSVAQSDTEKCHELILASQKNIENAIEENRKIAQGLVVPDFETIPFKEQISHLTDNMLKKAGIYVVMDTSGFREEMLDDEQRLAVYRVAQEQYTNIVKHAAAGFVYIRLNTTGHHFKMTIFDNGKGQAAGAKIAGIGLRNIRGRLALFNGTAKVETSPGKGFTLETVIPLNTDCRH